MQDTNLIPIQPNQSHFEDPNFRLRENNTNNGGTSTLKPSKIKNPVTPNTYQINQVDDLGNVTPSEIAAISFLRPAYDANRKTHVYSRATNLSNSDQVSYNDLTFGQYIHYIPNPNGGRGLLDQSSYATMTDVIISRNLVVATYSPY